MLHIAADSCRECGDDLRADESLLCAFCTSQAEAEARWADLDDAEGDRLAALPCGLCGLPVQDREPPQIHGVPVCESCRSYSLGVE